jgi:hypothetical protein
MSELKFNFDRLNKVVKALSGQKYVVKVGILGNKVSRKSNVLTNAEVGLVHEFGSASRKIPPRSFLRMPIYTQAEKIIKETSAGAENDIAEGRIVRVMTRLGVAAENAIQDAFGSAGFGNWAPDKPATVRRKGSESPLIDTAQLRKSISSKVEAV